MNRKQYRQGDLLIEECNPPVALFMEKKEIGSVLLAEGEKTGHKHMAHNVASREFVGNTVLWVPDKATVEHDEHEAIELDQGYYRVIQQRQFDHEAAERREESTTESRARFD